jgi:hypothetical protein
MYTITYNANKLQSTALHRIHKAPHKNLHPRLHTITPSIFCSDGGDDDHNTTPPPGQINIIRIHT